jgi:hypothetical protein
MTASSSHVLPTNRPVEAARRHNAGTNEEWPAWIVVAYRCFMLAFWTALILFAALVFYNTLFATPSSTTGASVHYAYPRPPG